MEGSLPKRDRFAKIPGGVLFAGLEAIDIAVYAAIAYHWFLDGDCFPSMRVLCEITSLSRPTIWKSLCRMEKVGIIQILRNNGSVSHYDLPLNRLTTLTGSPKPSVNRLSRLTATGKPPLQVSPKPVKQVNTNQTCTRSTEPDSSVSQAKRARKPSAPPGPVRELQNHFIAKLEEAFGEKPPTFPFGQSGRFFKLCLSTTPTESVLVVINAFFSEEWKWSGYTFDTFQKRYPQIKKSAIPPPPPPAKERPLTMAEQGALMTPEEREQGKRDLAEAMERRRKRLESQGISGGQA